MRVELEYFDDCPNWTVAYDRLAQALVDVGAADTVISLVQVTSEEQAVAEQFAGSPTIRIDGVDPFAPQAPQYGLACRVYATPDGMDGAPSLAQLVAALTSAP